jgi:hypothetical protein
MIINKSNCMDGKGPGKGMGYDAEWLMECLNSYEN